MKKIKEFLGKSIYKKIRIWHVLALLVVMFFSYESPEPDGIYRTSTSSEHSFISFSPPNNHHSDYITWVGNKRGRTSNCKTQGSYTYNKETKIITVSDLYNSNCPNKSKLNGEWKYKESYVVNPRGVEYHID